MKNYEVIFSISLKEHDVVKKFRVNVPAKEEVEAYDKALEFAENFTKFEIVSINGTDYIIPEPDEKEQEIDNVIRVGKALERLKKLQGIFEDINRGLTDIDDYIPDLRASLHDVLWALEIIEDKSKK